MSVSDVGTTTRIVAMALNDAGSGQHQLNGSNDGLFRLGSAAAAASFDMDSRDPNRLNEHLQVQWNDVIGEPESIRSNDCIWNCSYKVFRNIFYSVYTMLMTDYKKSATGARKTVATKRSASF